MAQGKEFPASSAQRHAPLCQASCGLVCSYRFPFRHEQRKLVRARVSVDSLLCNLWLLLRTRISRIHTQWTERRSWFTFVTWSGNLTNQISQRHDSMSPVVRKSVKKKVQKKMKKLRRFHVSHDLISETQSLELVSCLIQSAIFLLSFFQPDLVSYLLCFQPACCDMRTLRVNGSRKQKRAPNTLQHIHPVRSHARTW